MNKQANIFTEYMMIRYAPTPSFEADPGVLFAIDARFPPSRNQNSGENPSLLLYSVSFFSKPVATACTTFLLLQFLLVAFIHLVPLSCSGKLLALEHEES